MSNLKQKLVMNRKASRSDLEPEGETETPARRAGVERYALRRRVTPPEKLMLIDTSARDELDRKRGVV